MSIIALLVLKCDLSGKADPIILASEMDFSFQEEIVASKTDLSVLKQFFHQTGRTLAKKIPPCDRHCCISSKFNGPNIEVPYKTHAYKRNGLCVVASTDADFPFQIVEILLNQILDEYENNFGDSWKSVQKDSNQPWPYLKEYLTKYQPVVCWSVPAGGETVGPLAEERSSDLSATLQIPSMDRIEESKWTAWEEVENKLKTLYLLNHEEYLRELENLKDIAACPAQELRILYALVWNKVGSHSSIDGDNEYSLIPLNVWIGLVDNMLLMLYLLQKHPHISLTLEFSEELTNNYFKGPEYKGPVQICGDYRVLLEALSYQFFAGLKHNDPKSSEYIKRIFEEPALYNLCQNAIVYFREIHDDFSVAIAADVMIDLIYYKPPEETTTEWVKHTQCSADDRNPPLFVTPKLVPMDSLVNLVCTYGDKEMSDHAKLGGVYHLAITDKFSESLKSMLKFLYAPQNIDFLNQFEFNRALAQLGLCAFRAGHIAEADTCLSWLYAGGRVNELLGQTVSHLPIQDIRPKPLEQCRHIPYHMHINLELVEAVHLICAMLLEAANAHDAKANLTSQKFFQLAKSETSRRTPENVHDHIMAATWALRDGDFQETINVIESLDVWSFFRNRDNVLQMLKTKIKEIALVTDLSRSTEDPMKEDCNLTQKLSILKNGHKEIFENSIYNFP